MDEIELYVGITKLHRVNDWISHRGYDFVNAGVTSTPVRVITKPVVTLVRFEGALQPVLQTMANIADLAENSDSDLLIVDVGIELYRMQPILLHDYIEAIDLGPRAQRLLKSANIRRVGTLVWMSESELRTIRGFGKESLNDIKSRLDLHELSLRPDPSGPHALFR